ncbi:MAG: tetratricopeptide repeat protein [Chloroflexi bacterium]|nr:tetratricopeptide repeat protein [Chloroflexota bacterium]
MQTAITAAYTTPSATTGLRIYLLGPLRIERGHEPIRLPRRKVESLLAYLLLHPEQHTRDHLATLFWGDSSDEQARHSLRTALATVRKALDADLLHTERDHVQLNSAFPVWVDLQALLALEDALDGANGDFLQAQLTLWRGELLAGLYDDWLTIEREHYQTRLLKLCLQVTQALRARSEYGRAIAVAQQILTIDPANEAAHQHLIFCYVAAGDRAAALRQYEFCVRALRDELDAPPQAETTALYRWIKQSDGEELSAAAKITNLPLPLTSFVGRTREMAEVKRLLTLALHPKSQPENARRSAVRLLTLTGAGGSGKTRLAIQVATDLIDQFAQGVWWVELAALNEGGLVARSIAKTLGVREVLDQTLSQTVANFLGDKQLLLVIDNCEHLIEPTAQLAATLLSHCPNLQILTTSREPLNIAGETLWQVPTFAAPEPAKLSFIDLLLQFESLQLFVERAATVQPGFALTPENAQAIAEICQRLDGIPLAIELAAARIKVLSVEQIAAYLTGALGARFALLTQGNRAALPHHQTLRATIDWSFNLLDAAERLLFQQVAIFTGSFTLEALDQILTFGLPLLDAASDKARPFIPKTPLASPNRLDLLTQLVDKSLVIVESHFGQRRYRLLETLREYALEQFINPYELETLQRRHAEFYLSLAEQAEPALTSAAQQEWLARLEAEHANLRGALAYATAGTDRELALRLTAALFQFWDIRVYLSEGREWLSKALAQRGTASPQTQARALSAAGFLAHRQDDYPVARHLLHESLLLFEHVEDEVGIADVLLNLAAVDLQQGHYRAAHQRLTQSLELFRALNHNDGIARALNNMGNWAWDRGQHAVARDYYWESLQMRQQMGDQVGIATAFFNLGNAARAQGDFAIAQTYYEECLSLGRILDHRALIGIALKNLGLVAFYQADYPKARRHSEEALPLLLEIGDKSNAGFALANLGVVVQKLGETNQALAYFRQGLDLMHEVGYVRGVFLGLEDIAILLVDLDQHLELAVHLLSAADHLRQKTKLAVSPTQQPEYDRLLTRLRQQVDNATFNTQWDTGQTTPLDQIIATITKLTLS